MAGDDYMLALAEAESALLIFGDTHLLDLARRLPVQTARVSLDALDTVALEPRWSSRAYGSKVETVAAVWALRASAPLKARWLLLPCSPSSHPVRGVRRWR